jgi:hypothetical protein
MSEYYTFPTKAGAQACLDYINASPWFPVVGKKAGEYAPGNQATTQWATAPLELLSGEWCVPRIPNARLDYVGVPDADRASFMAAFGQDIRPLQQEDFVMGDP